MWWTKKEKSMEPDLYPITAPDKLSKAKTAAIGALNGQCRATNAASGKFPARRMKQVTIDNYSMLPFLLLIELDRRCHEDHGGVVGKFKNYTLFHEMGKVMGNDALVKAVLYMPTIEGKIKTSFQQKNATLGYVSVCGVSNETLQYAKKVFDESFDSLVLFEKTMMRMGDEDIFTRWASNDFKYKQSFFRTEDEMQVFAKQLKLVFTHKFKGSTFVPGRVADDSVDALMGKILVRERELWKEARQREIKRQEAAERQRKVDEEQTKVYEEAAKKHRMVEAARSNSETQRQRARARKQQAAEAQMSHPYEMGSAGGALQARLEELNLWKSRDEITAAAVMDKLINDTRKMFDMVDDESKVFGPAFLSVPNLMCVAETLGLDTKLKTPVTPVNYAANLEILRTMYNASPVARRKLESLLMQRDGTLLVAALVKPSVDLVEYANALVTFARDMEEANVTITTTKNKSEVDFIAGLTEDIARQRELLAAELRELIENPMAQQRGSGSTALPVTRQKKLPSWINEKVLGKEFQANYASDTIVVSSVEFPELTWEIALRDKPAWHAESFARGLLDFRAEKGQYTAYRDIIGELKELGFAIGDERKPQHVQHERYGIDVSLSGNAKELVVAALDLKAQLKEKQFNQNSMLSIAG